MIKSEHIPLIEKAMGFKLLPFQIHYLIGQTNRLGFTRASGRTTAYCIKLALSEGPPLDLQKPESFADMTGSLTVGMHMGYARNFFRREFMDIRYKLEEHGFKVREVKH